MRVAPEADGSSPAPLRNLRAKVFCFFAFLQARYRNPCLVIAGAGLQRQEGSIVKTGECVCFDIVELNKLGGVAGRPDDDVVSSFCCPWE